MRLHGETLSFRKITGLMSRLLPNHEESTFARVELPPAAGSEGDGGGWDPSERDHGDTRAFYNRAFLPAFEQYDAGDLFG